MKAYIVHDHDSFWELTRITKHPFPDLPGFPSLPFVVITDNKVPGEPVLVGMGPNIDDVSKFLEDLVEMEPLMLAEAKRKKNRR